MKLEARALLQSEVLSIRNRTPRLSTCATAALLLAACHAAGSDTDRQAEAGGGSATIEAGTGQVASDATALHPSTDAAGADGSSGTKDSGPSKSDAAGTTAPVTTGGCDRPGLVWKSAAKTNYESYPAPGSDECVKYKGCEYLGQFQACENTLPEAWVKAHDIASVYPLQGLELHNLCLRAGGKTMVVTAIDTCSDSDCEGCCSTNRGTSDRLIDLEKYTNERFGLADGPIEWADLGAAAHAFDGCNPR